MARVTFYEVNGQRYPEAEVTVVTEHRCDECGEFMPDTNRVSGTVSVVISGEEVQARQFEAHHQHAGEALGNILGELSIEMPWLPAF